MCLKPISCPTKSKYVNIKEIAPRLINTFNCGQCYECLKEKHIDYYLRSSAEYYDTIKHGGFVYWETFTYNQENVPVMTPLGLERGLINYDPTYSLFCFNRKDYVDFMKRLRINLTRLGYDIKGKLNQFFVSEYGGTTERPHYHCIFYIKFPGITPEQFYLVLKKSWTIGRLDDDKSPKQKVLNSLAAVNYVAKYVTKDDVFTKIIDSYVDKYKIDQNSIRDVYPFHRQGNSYGLSLVNVKNKEDLDLAITSGECFITDSQGKKKYRLPMYNIRKLFYTQYTSSDGTLHWQLNELGQKYKYNTSLQKLRKSAQRYEDTIKELDKLSKIIPNFPSNCSHFVRKLLNGRSSLDLAQYVLFYKGRLMHTVKPSLSDILRYDSSEKVFNYNDLFEPDEYGLKLSYDTIPIHENLYYNDGVTFVCNYPKKIKYESKEFVKSHSINQNSFTAFKHFDTILEYISIYDYSVSLGKQMEYNNKQEIKNRLRKLINKYDF